MILCVSHSLSLKAWATLQAWSLDTEPPFAATSSVTVEILSLVLKSVEPSSTVTREAVNPKKVTQCQILIAGEFF